MKRIIDAEAPQTIPPRETTSPYPRATSQARALLAVPRTYLAVTAALAATLLLLGAALVYLAEQASGAPGIDSFGEALWFAMGTMASVGYGDVVPQSGLGRAIGGLLTVAGLLLIGLFTATLAATLVVQRTRTEHPEPAALDEPGGPTPQKLLARVARAASAVGNTLRSYWQALRRENIPRVVAFSTVVLFVGATAVYVIEQGGDEPLITSFGESVWYTIVTMTTVGYGDFTPKTPVGRVFGTLLMLTGMGLLSLFTATIASIFVSQRIKEERGLEIITDHNHILVCGWNQYAERVLEGLCSAPGREGQVVLVNDLPEEAANEALLRYRERGVRFVRGDPAIEAVLLRANVRHARAAVVLADTSQGLASASDERTTLVTLALKSLKPEIKVTAEAMDVRAEAHLRRAGADDIVISGEFNGFLLSSAALAPGISQVVRSVLSLGDTELRREPIPSELVGGTFGELFQALRSRDGFLTVALVTESKGLTLDDLLADDYSLVDQFIRQQFTAAGKEYLRFEGGAMRVLVNPADSYVIGRDDTAIGIPRGT